MLLEQNVWYVYHIDVPVLRTFETKPSSFHMLISCKVKRTLFSNVKNVSWLRPILWLLRTCYQTLLPISSKCQFYESKTNCKFPSFIIIAQNWVSGKMHDLCPPRSRYYRGTLNQESTGFWRDRSIDYINEKICWRSRIS